MSQNMPSQTHYFSRLPFELRTRIWKMAFVGPGPFKPMDDTSQWTDSFMTPKYLIISKLPESLNKDDMCAKLLPPFIFDIDVLYSSVAREARRVFFCYNVFEIPCKYLRIFWRFCLRWDVENKIRKLRITLDQWDGFSTRPHPLLPVDPKTDFEPVGYDFPISSCTDLEDAFLFHHLTNIDIIMLDNGEIEIARQLDWMTEGYPSNDTTDEIQAFVYLVKSKGMSVDLRVFRRYEVLSKKAPKEVAQGRKAVGTESEFRKIAI